MEPTLSGNWSGIRTLLHVLKKQSEILPYINLLRAGLISDNFRSHPSNSSSKCHLSTLFTEFLTGTKVRYFEQVICTNKDTEKILNTKGLKSLQESTIQPVLLKFWFGTHAISSPVIGVTFKELFFFLMNDI